jgi:hypothetical protein
MQPDLLQQLRDIHLPEAPSLWPPAPGWWILLAAVLAAIVWAGYRVYRRWRRFAPVREAGRLYRALQAEFSRGACTPDEYLHRANALLKRLAVFGLRDAFARPLTGRAWLAYLDERVGAPDFSAGPGACLGDPRFRRQPAFDAAALHALLTRLFQSERARFWHGARDRAAHSQVSAPSRGGIRSGA